MTQINKNSERFYKQKLGNIYTYRLKTSVQSQLIQSPFSGITCPCCHQVSHNRASKEKIVQRLMDDQGFLCYFCFNTGHKHTENSQVASTIYQHKQAIIDIINKTNLVDEVVPYLTFSALEKIQFPNEWFEYASVENLDGKSQILITLPDNGKSYSFTILQWRKRLNSKLHQSESSFSVESNASKGIKETVHLERLQQVHTHGKIVVLKPAKSLSIMNCGEASFFGDRDNKIKVTHPNFELDVSKTKRRIDESGKEACFCIICATEKRLTIPRTAKNIELANKLWEFYAAQVAVKLGISDISAINVSRIQDNGCKLDTTKEKLLFKCHNPKHENITDTYSNRLNIKRSGYCKTCLQNAGVKNIEQLQKENLSNGDK